MRKGDLVRLNPDVCFTRSEGGNLEFPLTNYSNDEKRVVAGFYKLARGEKESWHNSDASKGMTSDGETKLCPSEGYISVYANRVYPVLRARCAPTLGFRKKKGQALILDTKTGKQVYVNRSLLEVVSE